MGKRDRGRGGILRTRAERKRREEGVRHGMPVTAAACEAARWTGGAARRAQRKAEDGASSARTRRPSGPRFFALSFQLSPVPLSLDPEKGPGS